MFPSQPLSSNSDIAFGIWFAISLLACICVYVIFTIPELISYLKHKDPSKIYYFTNLNCLLWQCLFFTANLLTLIFNHTFTIIPQICFMAIGISITCYFLIARYRYDLLNKKKK